MIDPAVIRLQVPIEDRAYGGNLDDTISDEAFKMLKNLVNPSKLGRPVVCGLMYEPGDSQLWR